MRWNDNRRQPMSGKHDKQKTRGAANTHNEKKDIIDPDTYFDGLCVCGSRECPRSCNIVRCVISSMWLPDDSPWVFYTQKKKSIYFGVVRSLYT